MTHSSPTTLLLCFHTPWQIWFTVFVQNFIVDLGLDVFGVDQRAIDVEDTSAYGWELASRRGVHGSHYASLEVP